VLQNQAFDLTHGLEFVGNTLGGMSSWQWQTMFQYQEMVKFLHEAIEWENLIYFVYPYFWDVPAAWDFVRTIEHPDPTRQQFVRAGSARVVLTVRSGFEDAFASFIDTGDFGDVLPPDHPYITIGQEIAAYAQTNYPGIPPANPETDYRPLLSPLQRKAWLDMQGIISLLGKYYQTNSAYPTTVQGLSALAELGTLPAADPWGNPYVYRSPGAYNDYELSSLGADGVPGGDGDNADITSWAPASLIGLWYDYTPTHGTDIQLNTAPANMQ
jgi:type II secretory pathway pseudopilin PulG